MTEWIVAAAGPARRRIDSLAVLLLLLAAALSLVGARLMVDPRGFRIAVAFSALALIVGLGFTSPKRLLYLLVVWLAALGLLRRLATTAGTTGTADPLLLVEAMALGVLALTAWSQGALRRRTRLSSAVLLFSVLMLAGALNPLQGSITGGLAGLLFTLVPMLAFWVGRILDDGTLRNVLKLIAGLALGAAAYGLSQTFRGFPSWDKAWISAHPDYVALNVPTYVNGVYQTAVRPFATFSAASEYAYFVMIALLVWLVLGLAVHRAALVAGAVGLLGVAAVYQSSRGVVVALIVAFGLMAGAYRRLSFGVAMTVAAATLVLLPFVVAQVAPTRYGTNTASTLVSHQLEGLAHPLNPHHSTLVTHFSIVVSGLHSALSEPVGLGVGAISIAGSKFGGVVRGTEADPSNVAVALGIPGLLTYIVVLVLGFLRAYGVATKRHDRLAFAALGILTLTNFQWLNGGQYAVAFLPWLILGWVDRQAQVVEAPTDQVARPRHVRGSASEARPGAVGT